MRAEVDAVGNITFGLNHISASFPKPAGGNISAPVKKLRMVLSDKPSICPSAQYIVRYQ